MTVMVPGRMWKYAFCYSRCFRLTRFDFVDVLKCRQISPKNKGEGYKFTSGLLSSALQISTFLANFNYRFDQELINFHLIIGFH